MNFDRLAPHYHRLEALSGGGLLQRARTAWLDELKDCRSILSAGEGHGRFAAACTARFPATRLTCIEASAAMIAAAKAHLGSRGVPIRWHHAELLHWGTGEKFDAIVTCFFLDCFPPDELAAVIGKLAGCAAPKAVWLVVDFSIPAGGFARWRAKAVHTLMYAFFRRAVALPARRLTTPDALLQAQGFQLSGRREYNCGLVRADLWRRS